MIGNFDRQGWIAIFDYRRFENINRREGARDEREKQKRRRVFHFIPPRG